MPESANTWTYMRFEQATGKLLEKQFGCYEPTDKCAGEVIIHTVDVGGPTKVYIDGLMVAVRSLPIKIGNKP